MIPEEIVILYEALLIKSDTLNFLFKYVLTTESIS
jgi:hypothetical protein